ncbi:CATRA conflict system CASPASE/TPR repeat-associated protein [Geodermatophilus normandii]|uniref:CATRA conflict system CASPASE/TPR repeat-associated protein n=1 Tax=Geodermatophilus normandii TaxID=1137989 RepID=UPI0011B5B7DD|nr:CATRA conflict system CASPASE/TPR repeat-associated protein [Geodermatophilus normandii]
MVHLFVAGDGEEQDADHEFVLNVWQACADPPLGMTEPLRVPDLPVEPSAEQLAERGLGSRLLAGRQAPLPDEQGAPHVQQALLRREHDSLCISVVREPPPASRKGWCELDDEWSEVVRHIPSPPGLLGSARLFVAQVRARRPPRPTPAVTRAVQARWAAPTSTGQPFTRGVTVPPGFAVWEDFPPTDDRIERRIVVVGARGEDAALSAWTWVGPERTLPPLGRYLLHAAKVRYQWRIWDAEQGFRQLRRQADATVQRLLPLIGPATVDGQRQEPSQAQLVRASHELDTLQADELSLVQTVTRLREMRRTVDIAAANQAAAIGQVQLDGPFASDRSLSGWFGQQLEDDAAYLEAARERASQVTTLADQLVGRGQQRRQERFNLGLTGIVGAILMSLAAIQSLNYEVPVSGPVKPALITTLGLLTMLVSMVVLRFAVPDRRWPVVLVWMTCGATAAAATWIGMAAIAGGASSPARTWLWAGLSFLAGTSLAWAVTSLRRGCADSAQAPT